MDSDSEDGRRPSRRAARAGLKCLLLLCIAMGITIIVGFSVIVPKFQKEDNKERAKDARIAVTTSYRRYPFASYPTTGIWATVHPIPEPSSRPDGLGGYVTETAEQSAVETITVVVPVLDVTELAAGAVTTAVVAEVTTTVLLAGGGVRVLTADGVMGDMNGGVSEQSTGSASTTQSLPIHIFDDIVM
ncbi:hypothetical protein DRE_00704 [Drechslerella stenobrocha 248]|uniref:Uncharacterized protein n=1 Tax=Drechslerella stenobrocha 248 TaxID=1043628 RepID=W7I8G0_9PEZI|nr:hypothetical protein DRE_00704 [Drechslerella stenobrocha 248]